MKELQTPSDDSPYRKSPQAMRYLQVGNLQASLEIYDRMFPKDRFPYSPEHIHDWLDDTP